MMSHVQITNPRARHMTGILLVSGPLQGSGPFQLEHSRSQEPNPEKSSSRSDTSGPWGHIYPL